MKVREKMMNMNIMNTNMNDIFMIVWSITTTIMFARAIYVQYLPPSWRESIQSFFMRYMGKIVRFFSPYIDITFEEYTGERFNKNQVYTTIETYLSERTSVKARVLKANFVKDGTALMLGLGDHEEVMDEFEGVKVWWKAHKHLSRSTTISVFPGTNERRYYKLTFHGRHRDLVTESYLTYVLDEGKAIAIRKRQRKLYTNVESESGGSYHSRGALWSHVEFKHPATFDTLAMHPTKKQSIINDLIRFRNSKDYYTKIGKPWKRGYLLFGPPGTGKSTMIAAMANMLEYDVYDLELTAVKNNTQLRRLIIETSSKAIVLIEDIDCSLELTGQRSKNEEEKDDDEKDEGKKIAKKAIKDEKKSEVTLSGLLNFIDGIWSACGEERLIIFTTNYVEKLDPALVRRGRMDVHVELSYCCYESFKVLARNYLDVETHPLFETIERLLMEIKITPADVAESLMPKSLELDARVCLDDLVSTLEKVKEEEEKKMKKEEEEKIMNKDNLELDNEVMKNLLDEKKENGGVVVENDKKEDKVVK